MVVSVVMMTVMVYVILVTPSPAVTSIAMMFVPSPMLIDCDGKPLATGVPLTVTVELI